jgi:hypothetical protein
MFKLLKEFLVTGIESNKVGQRAAEISERANKVHIEASNQMRILIAKQLERADIDNKIANNEVYLQAIRKIQMKESLKEHIATIKAKKRKTAAEMSDISEYEAIVKSMEITV